MRIAIDWDLCIGSGLCVLEGDGAFALAPYKAGERAIVVDGAVADEALWRAARACPMLAIRLSDASGRRIFPPEPAARAPQPNAGGFVEQDTR
jgi:ferredoxin